MSALTRINPASRLTWLEFFNAISPSAEENERLSLSGSAFQALWPSYRRTCVTTHLIQQQQKQPIKMEGAGPLIVQKKKKNHDRRGDRSKVRNKLCTPCWMEFSLRRSNSNLTYHPNATRTLVEVEQTNLHSHNSRIMQNETQVTQSQIGWYLIAIHRRFAD